MPRKAQCAEVHDPAWWRSLPPATTDAEVAEHFGLRPRTVSRERRRLGVYRLQCGPIVPYLPSKAPDTGDPPSRTLMAQCPHCKWLHPVVSTLTAHGWEIEPDPKIVLFNGLLIHKPCGKPLSLWGLAGGQTCSHNP